MFRLSATLCVFVFAAFLYSQESQPAELPRLAERLGDRDYRIREESGKRFLVLGAEALPTLRKLVETGNREASERAVDLIAKIEKRADHEKEMSGKLVELDAKQQSVGEALASLRKQTGYALELVGDQKPLSNTVTPKGGKTLFWNALNDLADAAGLVIEQDAPNKAWQGIGIGALARPDTFALRKRSIETANPVCISGAVRMEAVPGPLAFARQLPPDRFAVILQISPEPRCCWEETTEVLLLNARDQDGRSLAFDQLALDPLIDADRYGRVRIGGRFRTGDGDESVELKPSQSPLIFQSQSSPSSKLKTFEGVVRGRIWGQPEPLLTIAKLSSDFREITGANGLSMKAKVEPLHGEPNSLCLAVVVHYETSVIPTAVWDGLTLSDGAGKTMVLKTLGVATENLRLNDPVRPWGSYRLTARYALRPANPADKLDPQKLVFSGCRSISVEIPFHLKDVPLSRGTGGHAIPKLEISK